MTNKKKTNPDLTINDDFDQSFTTFFNDETDESNDIFDFDEAFKKSELKRQRRARKNGPDTVQLLAEEFQKTKNPRLWTKIFDILWHGLVAHCFQVTRNYAMAEDTALEIMTRAFERIDEYNPEISKFSTWVWMMGFRQALRDHTVESRNPAPISKVIDNADITTVVSDEKRNQFGLDYYGDFYEQDIELNERLYESSVQNLYNTSINAIQNVKKDVTRQVLKMKLIDNCTIKEIGTRLNLTESNVKNHLYTGKREIADQIKKTHPELYNTYVETGYVLYQQ